MSSGTRPLPVLLVPVDSNTLFLFSFLIFWAYGVRIVIEAFPFWVSPVALVIIHALSTLAMLLKASTVNTRLAYLVQTKRGCLKRY